MIPVKDKYNLCLKVIKMGALKTSIELKRAYIVDYIRWTDYSRCIFFVFLFSCLDATLIVLLIPSLDITIAYSMF